MMTTDWRSEEVAGGTIQIVTSRAGQPILKDSVDVIKQTTAFALHRVAVCTDGRFAFFRGDWLSISHKPSGMSAGTYTPEQAEALFSALSERHHANGLWATEEIPKSELDWAKQLRAEVTKELAGQP